MSDVIASKFDWAPPTAQQFKDLTSGLSEEERHLLLDHGEEAPFCGVFLTEQREGVYTCRFSPVAKSMPIPAIPTSA